MGTFERGTIRVEELRFGERTELRGRILILDRDGLGNFLTSRDDRLASCVVSLARPGESTRIICVKDVIQPSCKVEGKSLGSGTRKVLENVALVTCGRIVGFQEGIIDMSGEGARYSPFSSTFNVVLDLTVVPGLSPHQHEEVIRRAGHAAADFIGQTAGSAPVVRVETFVPIEKLSFSPHLPRVVYIYMLLSQGLLHETFVLGRRACENSPRIIDPLMLLDNAVSSGNCVSACDKNTSWHHQNNPVLLELFRRHTKELNFAGVVLTCEPVRLGAKEQAATATISLVQELQADGAILSKEGFGNPDADQMLITRGLERAGVRLVAISDEFAGQEGDSQSLADTSEEADALVSVGNANERILLPPMDEILGPLRDLSRLAGAWPHSLHGDGSLEVELQAIIGSTNELGMQKLSCREV